MRVKIDTPRGLYVSDQLKELTLDEILDLVRNAVKGNVSYFQMKIDGNTTYFPEALLTQSVITVITNKDQA